MIQDLELRGTNFLTHLAARKVSATKSFSWSIFAGAVWLVMMETGFRGGMFWRVRMCKFGNVDTVGCEKGVRRWSIGGRRLDFVVSLLIT